MQRKLFCIYFAPEQKFPPVLLSTGDLPSHDTLTKIDQACMINSLLKSKDLATEVTHPLIRIYNIKETSFID